MYEYLHTGNSMAYVLLLGMKRRTQCTLVLYNAANPACLTFDFTAGPVFHMIHITPAQYTPLQITNHKHIITIR